MQTQRPSLKSLKSLQLAALPLLGLLAACGAQPTATPPLAVGVGNPALAATPEQFVWQCQANGGSVISISGTTVCRSKVVNQPNVFITIPLVRMNPSQPNSGSVLSVISGVRKYDKVTLGSQGSYGANCGVFDCSNTTSYSMSGVSSATGSVVLVGGIPAGLVVSDGVQVYDAGNSNRVTINNDGVLRIGFNSPSASVTSGLTTTPALNRILIERCVDINNQTYSCP